MKIVIDCQPEHLAALRDACELYLRVALGQFADVAVEHEMLVAEETGKSTWDIGREVEAACRVILTPHFGPGMAYGIGNPAVSQKSRMLYELWKLLGGGTDGAPLNYSGVPLPTVTVEK